jgi:F-type H+-transporting ATPase subunit alpha
MKLLDDYIKTLEKELSRQKITIDTKEVGILKEVKDGVAILIGLNNGFYGEIVVFENGVEGFIIDLAEDSVGVVILGDYLTLEAGDQARSTGRVLSVPVGEGFLGKVIDPLGNPLDKSTRVKSKQTYPVEKIAPSVIYRRPVDVPLQTGIKAIDALVPIGRGQRELIIGDRGTGKTTLAIDAILNQKKENVICIYCAVGQKNSKIASVVELLREHEAMDYTVVVASAAADPAAMQYLAPYSATAIAEYFMDQKKDVLIVYDDLTKHAWAYRQMSLILRRPAGREAYPGDIFYLHSKLLERSCRRDEKFGGGSITALPIIETLEGELSAYIPTNVISITDGQIFLQTDLFNSGIRPAIDVGISVSRVGGNAQTRAIKQVAGKLKLDLAQYREMAAFSQFESELDDDTRKLLNRGAKVTQILRQKKNTPYSLAEQVALIWVATNGYLDETPLNKIEKFETVFIDDLKSRSRNLLKRINTSKSLTKDDEKELERVAKINLKNL